MKPLPIANPLTLELLETVNDLSDAERHALGYFVLLFPTWRNYHDGGLTELGWLKQIRATLDTLHDRVFIHEANAGEREVLAVWIASTDRRINALSEAALFGSLADSASDKGASLRTKRSEPAGESRR